MPIHHPSHPVNQSQNVVLLFNNQNYKIAYYCTPFRTTYAGAVGAAGRGWRSASVFIAVLMIRVSLLGPICISNGQDRIRNHGIQACWEDWRRPLPRRGQRWGWWNASWVELKDGNVVCYQSKRLKWFEEWNIEWMGCYAIQSGEEHVVYIVLMRLKKASNRSFSPWRDPWIVSDNFNCVKLSCLLKTATISMRYWQIIYQNRCEGSVMKDMSGRVCPARCSCITFKRWGQKVG